MSPVLGGAGSIAVVSPHLDDAALSLGATVARAVREGADVRVVTVFAGRPDAEAEPGKWDRRGGFASEGEAARGRRNEDEAAWALLGARPAWLPFADQDYPGERNEEEVWRLVADAVADVELALVPGFPLTHPDHAWLSQLLVGRRLPVPRTALYVEQPYAFRVRSDHPRPGLAPALAPLLGVAPVWRRHGRDPRLTRRKATAIRAYRSQLPLLGFTASHGQNLRRVLLWELRGGGEATAFLD
jgi:LmbE family N-acetylglucosaminyl deacetylase